MSWWLRLQLKYKQNLLTSPAINLLLTLPLVLLEHHLNLLLQLLLVRSCQECRQSPVAPCSPVSGVRAPSPTTRCHGTGPAPAPATPRYLCPPCPRTTPAATPALPIQLQLPINSPATAAWPRSTRPAASPRSPTRTRWAWPTAAPAWPRPAPPCPPSPARTVVLNLNLGKSHHYQCFKSAPFCEWIQNSFNILMILNQYPPPSSMQHCIHCSRETISYIQRTKFWELQLNIIISHHIPSSSCHHCHHSSSITMCSIRET